ncbi:hypothetical protein DPMN_059521 [Dreissena polymorpha]|uniref:Uncharacterized protein n=1 Tax=Dreissena polymorpha TaxID=45954 RepID=A0A9D4HF48_DREPO|nr:hypothetical protein DPMN_059521 [Dreissena polymorpha]
MPGDASKPIHLSSLTVFCVRVKRPSLSAVQLVHNLLMSSLRCPWQFLFGPHEPQRNMSKSDKFASKHLKLPIFSSFLPFMVMSVPVVFILYFSVLTSIPYFTALAVSC